MIREANNFRIYKLGEDDMKLRFYQNKDIRLAELYPTYLQRFRSRKGQILSPQFISSINTSLLMDNIYYKKNTP